MTSLPTDEQLAALDTLVSIEVPVPTSCSVIVYPSTEFPGEFYIKASVETVDVVTGEHDAFTSTWRGVRPTRGEIVTTIVDILRHEVEEHLDLDPHGLKK
jgi:hypothetical protein